MTLKKLAVALEENSPVEVVNENIEFAETMGEAEEQSDFNNDLDSLDRNLNEINTLGDDVTALSEYQENVTNLIDSSKADEVATPLVLETIRNTIKSFETRWGIRSPNLNASLSTESFNGANVEKNLQLVNEDFKDFIKTAYEAVKNALLKAYEWFKDLIVKGGKWLLGKINRFKARKKKVSDLDPEVTPVNNLLTYREKVKEEKKTEFKNEGTVLASKELAAMVDKELITYKDLMVKVGQISGTLVDVAELVSNLLQEELESSEFMSANNRRVMDSSQAQRRNEGLDGVRETVIARSNKKIEGIVGILEKAHLSKSFTVSLEKEEGKIHKPVLGVFLDKVSTTAEFKIPENKDELTELSNTEGDLIKMIEETQEQIKRISETFEKFIKNYEKALETESDDEEINKSISSKIKGLMDLQRAEITTSMLIIRFLMRISNIYSSGIEYAVEVSLKLMKEPKGD